MNSCFENCLVAERAITCRRPAFVRITTFLDVLSDRTRSMMVRIN